MKNCRHTKVPLIINLRVPMDDVRLQDNVYNFILKFKGKGTILFLVMIKEFESEGIRNRLSHQSQSLGSLGAGQRSLAEVCPSQNGSLLYTLSMSPGHLMAGAVGQYMKVSNYAMERSGRKSSIFTRPCGLSDIFLQTKVLTVALARDLFHVILIVVLVNFFQIDMIYIQSPRYLAEKVVFK